MRPKVIFTGASKTGKTTCSSFLATGRKPSTYKPTMGVELRQTPDYDIWDVSGSPKFHGLRGGYYIGANIAVFFCDAADPKSIKDIPFFVNELNQNCPKILVVNNRTEETNLDEIESYFSSIVDISSKDPSCISDAIKVYL